MRWEMPWVPGLTLWYAAKGWALLGASRGNRTVNRVVVSSGQNDLKRLQNSSEPQNPRSGVQVFCEGCG